ncbi:MAG: caspase family protein [Armatimonadetes bacterium]|nr:caspase family protein [Armatimonadota bacterium]
MRTGAWGAALLLLCVWQTAEAIGAAPQKVAVVVGCNGYSSGWELLGPRYDAVAVADALKRAGYRVYTMNDEAKSPDGAADYPHYYPSLAHLRNQLPVWFAKGGFGADDTVLFYFAGHGFHQDGVDYLAPLEASLPASPEGVVSKADLLPLPEVLAGMVATGAGNVVVIADACRADAIQVRGVRPRNLGTSADLKAMLGPLPAGLRHAALFSSCGSGESSYAGPAGGGWYTQALVTGLGGASDADKDGAVTAAELHDYCRAEVVRQAAAASRRQVPQVADVPGRLAGLVLAGAPTTEPAKPGNTVVVVGDLARLPQRPPDLPVTSEDKGPAWRGELAQTLYNHLQLWGVYPKINAAAHYDDVGIEHPNYMGVCWAAQTGVMMGFPDGRWHPETASTRFEMANLARRYLDTASLEFGRMNQAIWPAYISQRLQQMGLDPQPANVQAVLAACGMKVEARGRFRDVPPDHWAYDAVEALADAGLLGGYPDGTFRGQWPATRKELKWLLNKANAYLEDLPGNPSRVNAAIDKHLDDPTTRAHYTLLRP